MINGILYYVLCKGNGNNWLDFKNVIFIVVRVLYDGIRYLGKERIIDIGFSLGLRMIKGIRVKCEIFIFCI